MLRLGVGRRLVLGPIQLSLALFWLGFASASTAQSGWDWLAIRCIYKTNHHNLQDDTNGKLGDWIQLRERKIQVWSGLGPALLQLV